MRAKNYKIAVNKHTGDIPDYVSGTPECLRNYYEKELEKLNSGFNAQPDYTRNWWKTEEAWREHQGRIVKSYDYNWVEPLDFTAEYEIFGFERGRSSATLIMKNVDTGGTVHMMAADLPEIAQHVNKGRIEGVWKVAKCGANYRLKFVSVAPEFSYKVLKTNADGSKTIQSTLIL